MGGRAGVIRSRFGGWGWLPWAAGLVVVLAAAVVGSFLFKLLPAGAPAIGSLITDSADTERPAVRPYLGITYQELSTRSGDHSGAPAIAGAVVVSIAPGSPAAMAGLRTGDVILAVNGEALGRDNTLLNVLLKHEPGDRVRLMVQRGQEHLSLEVLLGKQ